MKNDSSRFAFYSGGLFEICIRNKTVFVIIGINKAGQSERRKRKRDPAFCFARQSAVTEIVVNTEFSNQTAPKAKSGWNARKWKSCFVLYFMLVVRADQPKNNRINMRTNPLALVSLKITALKM